MTTSEPAVDPIEELLAQILETSASNVDEALEAACQEHPEWAEELRQRMQFLRESGLLESVTEQPQPKLAAEPSFRAGDRLLDFEILDLLGTGGMGEVYRALDTRLQREVAIKVLAENLASDSGRLKRLAREARTLAGLNHPNVAQIHHLEEAKGRDFLVLEYVPGHDLAHLLAHGPLDQEAAIAFALQIAEGLEAAHEAGIVHRDLKPANLRVTPDGVLKVLDFGLATESPTTALPATLDGDSNDLSLTRDGSFLGTPKYMSPEQVRARRTDRRADIWAFGCVFWECLTGSRPFEGSDFAELAHRILREEPDWTSLPKDLPAVLVRLLQRCLAKDPRDRLRDIGEARILLQRVLDGQDHEPLPAVAAPPFATRAHVLWSVALIVSVVAAWLFAEAPPAAGEAPSKVLHLSAYLSRDTQLEARTYSNLSVSADLTRMAWVGGPQARVFVRELDGYGVTPIAGSDGAASPFLSPDGEWIAFFVGDRLMKARTDGTGLVDLFDEASHGNEIALFGTENRGGTWLDDGTIVFCPSVQDGLFRIHADGTGFARLTTPDPKLRERTHRWPRAIPGRNMLVFTVDDDTTTEDYDDASIALFDLDRGERRPLLSGASFARASASTLAFVRGDALYAQELDLDRRTVRGTPQLILPDVRIDRSSGAAQCDLSADGSVVYAPMTPFDAATRLTFWNDGGRNRAITRESGAYFEPAMSADEQTLAYISSRGGQSDVWVFDREDEVHRRLTTTGACFSPAWHPNGMELAYLSRDPMPWGIYTIAADGQSEPELLFETGGDWAAPFQYINEGRHLLMVWQRESTGRDIVLLDTETGETLDILATDAAEEHPSLSPDGRWLAFTSDRSGQEEVYLAPFPAGEPAVKFSVEGGLEPRWSANGSRLTFVRRESQDLWVMPFVEGTDGPMPQRPRRLLRDFFYNQDARFFYTVAGSRRFVTSVFDWAESDVGRELRVVEGAAVVSR